MLKTGKHRASLVENGQLLTVVLSYGIDDLPGIIERNNKDIPLRWIKIEYDSCFIHDRGGGQAKTAPPSDAADEGFPKVHREVMFCAVSVAVFHSM